VLVAAAALGFLVPAFRDTHEPTRVDRESYFGSAIGLLPDEPRDPADRRRSRTNAARKRPRD
jgi:hypothetical protein